MGNVVVDFLKVFAMQQNYNIYDSVFGELKLTAPLPIKQSTGAVYGVLVKLETVPPIVNFIPDDPGWHPVIWGKDIKPISRISAHVQNYNGTGNSKLKMIEAIRNKPLIFGAIFEERYESFEKLLYNIYEPMIGSDRTGKKAHIIEILS